MRNDECGMKGKPSLIHHSSFRIHHSEIMDGQQRIPILKVGRVLIVPIQVDMDDQTVIHLQERILTELERTGARGVLIDISLLEMVDSFIGRMLSDIATMAHTMDARSVVVGMQPTVTI